MSRNLIVAIDIGSLTNSVNLMDHNGNSLHELKKLSNNLPGISNLWTVATTLLKEYNLDGIDFVMESSGPYWFGPYWWLKNQCSALQSSSVTALNSQIVSGFKGKFSHKKQKNDPKDAKTIGDRFRFGNFDPVHVPQGNILALRFLTRYRLSIVQKLVAAKGIFLGYLFFKMNEYSRYSRKGNKLKQKLFSNTFGAASSALITKYPSAEDLVAAPLDELISLIKDTSRGTIKDVSEKATLAQKIAHDSYPLPEELKAPIHFILQETLSLIEFLQKQIQRVDEKIEPILSSLDDPIRTIPGIGTVFAAGILAETGDLKRFKGHPQLASYFGIIPSMNDSGEFKSSMNHMTKTGNSYGRYYLIEAANAVRKFNPVFQNYFQKKLTETTPRRFKRALGLTARKLIRVYYAMKMKNCKFNKSLLPA